MIGNSKDGMPIILGNVDSPAVTPAQPADAIRPGAMTPLPAPTISLEKTPANQLSHPVETFSSAGPERPADKQPAAGTATSAASPAKPGDGAAPASGSASEGNIIPRSLSDVEALLKRLMKTESATTERKPPEAAASGGLRSLVVRPGGCAS